MPFGELIKETVTMETKPFIHDVPYLDLLALLLSKGAYGPERTNTGAYTVFGHQMRFDCSETIPFLNSKAVHVNSVIAELVWFMKGNTNIKELLENSCNIWTDWRYKDFKECNPDSTMDIQEFAELIKANSAFASKWGNIGKGYGHQWRNYGGSHTSWFNANEGEGFDQLAWVIREIKENPTSRRLIVTGWNPHEVEEVDLPPCHTLFQFHVEPFSDAELIAAWEHKLGRKWEGDSSGNFLRTVCRADKIPTGKISCQLYQRSADVFLGVPFNIASYALLLHFVAKATNTIPADFVWTGGNVHLYANHVDQAKQQLGRNNYSHAYPTVDIELPKYANVEVMLNNVGLDAFTVQDYYPLPPIKAPVAV